MTDLKTSEADYLSPRPWDWSWSLWFLLPIYPYGRRRTLRREIVSSTIWTFEQIQGIFYVVVPIRMTVIRLESGGLLIYAPVAPTPECIRMVKDLEAKHGSVKHILLPTASGLEHKVFVGPFARWFPEAQVYVAPRQWSFPVNLPLPWLGFPPDRTHILSEQSKPPFANEFDYAILEPIRLGLGFFTEVALFHRRSRTLLVTDSVVSVPAEPPEVVQLDPYPLLFHAKDRPSDPIQDNEAIRRKGWQRIALFSFYFRPSALEIAKLAPSLQEVKTASDRSPKNFFGWYPFQWQENWQKSFEALRGNGRLFVAPILQTLILNREPKAVLDWANRIAQWNFQQIIPCHFDAPIQSDAQTFRRAFSFLEKHPSPSSSLGANDLPAEDFELLRDLEKNLNRRGIVPPRKEKV